MTYLARYKARLPPGGPRWFLRNCASLVAWTGASAMLAMVFYVLGMAVVEAATVLAETLDNLAATWPEWRWNVCSCEVAKNETLTKTTTASTTTSRPAPFDLGRAAAVLVALQMGGEPLLQRDGQVVPSYRSLGVSPTLADDRFKLTFDELPSEVVANMSIVEGWPPDKERRLPIYIRPWENTVLSDITCLNLSAVRFLVVVKSTPELLDYRASTRETFGQFSNQQSSFKIIFLTGTTENATVRQQMKAEVKKHCDLLTMDFVDHYNNLTLKSVSAIKFVLTTQAFGKEKLGKSKSSPLFVNLVQLE